MVFNKKDSRVYRFIHSFKDSETSQGIALSSLLLHFLYIFLFLAEKQIQTHQSLVPENYSTVIECYLYTFEVYLLNQEGVCFCGNNFFLGTKEK